LEGLERHENKCGIERLKIDAGPWRGSVQAVHREADTSTGFVYLRPLIVVSAIERGSHPNASRAAWERMFAWLQQSDIRRSVGTCYGLLLNEPKSSEYDSCRYDACVELIDGCRDRVPQDFHVRRLPGSVYARRRHVGGTQTLWKTITELRDKWAPEQGLTLDQRRPVIEVYFDDPSVVPEAQRKIDICMPVTAATDSGQSAA
jgi:DNA gyrase inhibitor GyrI